MARSKTPTNGHLQQSLEAMQQAQTTMLQAVADLHRNQIALSGQHSDFLSHLSRIEATLAEHSRSLDAHGRILEALTQAIAALPDAMGRKFGFRPPESHGTI